VTAIHELARRGIPMLRAKRVVEALMESGRAHVALPLVEDSAALVAALAACGIEARAMDATAPVDAKAIREALGLTQEQFALRFGLELAALRNWETGRREPDTAARSYLRVIARQPEAVEAALATG
jgi:putative transcriptional regulator